MTPEIVMSRRIIGGGADYSDSWISRRDNKVYYLLGCQSGSLDAYMTRYFHATYVMTGENIIVEETIKR